MVQFNRKQLHEDALIQKGRYPFRVLQSREKCTNGTDMLILKHAVSINNREIQLWDTLFFSPKMFWKAEHFCYATGMPEKLDENMLMAQDCDGKEGYLDIAHRVNKETGELEAYVKDYVKPENLEVQSPSNDQAPSFDDDVPSFT